MRFGPVAVAEAAGSILAHSLRLGDLRLKKGRVLSAADVAALIAAGAHEVTVATLADDDIGEDHAARLLARALVPEPGAAGLRISAPFAGRVNIHAEIPGLVRLDTGAAHRFNATDASITLATLPDLVRVSARSLVATVKIIPYGVAESTVDTACAAAPGALKIAPFSVQTASLILTRTPGMKQSLLSKGEAVVLLRVLGLGCELVETLTVAHEVGALAQALVAAKGEMVLLLTGSATSDANDVGPKALSDAGGTLTRFGMPVDPGNLLFLGDLNDRPVLGLPGCARSPALNGADWVLERIACGLEVSGADIATMGVGGLLKEIPTRPQPRGGRARPPARPHVEVLLLAAGASARMQGRDKLLEPVAGAPLLRRTARVAAAAQVDRVHVVLPPENAARRKALDGLGVQIVISAEWQEGMAASLRAGMAAVSQTCDAVIVALADMPEVSAAHFDRLVAAFDPEEGREICRAVAGDGTPGHPVLFGRRFFESLAALTGDRGAKEVLRDAGEFVTDVATAGQGAVVDLDTPQDWQDWRGS